MMLTLRLPLLGVKLETVCEVGRHVTATRVKREKRGALVLFAPRTHGRVTGYKKITSLHP